MTGLGAPLSSLLFLVPLFLLLSLRTSSEAGEDLMNCLSLA